MADDKEITTVGELRAALRGYDDSKPLMAMHKTMALPLRVKHYDDELVVLDVSPVVEREG